MLKSKEFVPSGFYRIKTKNIDICERFYQRVKECPENNGTIDFFHPFNCERTPCFALCCLCSSQRQNFKMGCLLPMRVKYSSNDFEHSINDERIRLAIDYIDKNYEEKITLNRIGEIVGLSIARLSSLFTIKTGEQFMCHLIKRRLYESVRHLLEGDKNMSEICYLVGWSSPASFTHRFKHLFGVTPKDFRGLALIKMEYFRSRFQINCGSEFKNNLLTTDNIQPH